MSGFSGWLSKHLEELQQALGEPVEQQQSLFSPYGRLGQAPAATADAASLGQRAPLPQPTIGPDLRNPGRVVNPTVGDQVHQQLGDLLTGQGAFGDTPLGAAVSLLPQVQLARVPTQIANGHPLAGALAAGLLLAPAVAPVVRDAVGPAAKVLNSDSPFAIFTAENPGGVQASELENAAHMARARAYLDAQGLRYAPTTGRYLDNTTNQLLQENGFLVHGISDEQARALGKQFGQNGVITRTGYHDLANKTLFPSRGVGPTSGIPHTDVGGRRFALDIDWENGLPQGAVPDAARIAKSLQVSTPMSRVTAVDPDRARAMAQAYEALPKNDPNAKAAYDALNRDVAKQAQAIQDAGYSFDFVDKDPYKNSAEMMADVRDNKRLKVLKTPTEGSFHPYMTPEQNDTFRAVHDFLAHAGGGNQFGPVGEENAYRMHASTLSPEALPALATETRGQNSWVNFGPNAALPANLRPFAEQKAALFPSHLLGEYDAMPASDATRYARAGEDLNTINGRLSQVAGNTPMAELSDRDWLHAHLLQSEQDRLGAERVLTAPAAGRSPLPPAPGAGFYDVQLPNGRYRAIQASSPQEASLQGRVIRYQRDGWQPDPRNPNVEPPTPRGLFSGPEQEYLANRASGFGRAGSTGVNMMGTIAGAGAGGLAGATQGNTPAERFRNAAIGALGGGALGYAAPELTARALGEAPAAEGSAAARAGAIGDQPRLTPKMQALQDTPAAVEARVSDALTRLRQPLVGAPAQGELFNDRRSLLDRSLVVPDQGPTTAALPTRQAFGSRQAAGHVAELPSNLNRAAILQQVVRGLNEGTPERFYPSFKAVSDAIAQHGGDERAFRAATSAGSIQQGVPQEIANGSRILYALKQGAITPEQMAAAKTKADWSALRGKIMDVVAKDFPGQKSRGMLTGDHVRSFYKLLTDQPAGAYKIPTYFAQKAGDVPGFVLDGHESRGGTLGSPFHRFFDSHGQYQTAGEYGAQEQNYRELAHTLGVSDRTFQAARWAGGGNVTGLRTPPTLDWAQIFEGMLRQNAERQGLAPQELLRRVAKQQGVLF